MNSRSLAIQEISSRKPLKLDIDPRTALEKFEHQTFNRMAMKKSLPKEVFHHMLEVMAGKAKVNPQFADAVAEGMKDWAVANGATHFCHWFQPLTGLAAEKHDAFIDWKDGKTLIETFNGKHLFRGEPDGSSFPSGGLRSTATARGYTTWDPASPAFLWKMGHATILCIPSFFFSWTGEALDMKIPLIRSEAKLNDALLRLLRLLDIPAKHTFATLGCEQEYFLVDQALCNLRPDLLLAGRTVFGAPSPKGQELEDHYFRPMKERVLSFIQDFEAEAYGLGIPLKTRHGEVAPGQYEAAPIYERASLAIDHNVLLMELMREVGRRHHLVCLLHEKPFAGINGSGKHNNWSLSTDTGLNLFDPSDAPADNPLFIILLAATLDAVYKHADLLRASIASAGNDHRLGGNEAPPAIISVFLGEVLEDLLDSIEKGTEHQTAKKKTFDLKIPIIPELPLDHSDRNRTSPFAFTGNKFEFRAVGSSANCAFPVTVLNVALAEQLNIMLDEIEEALKGKDKKNLKAIALSVVKKHLKDSKKILFSGNGYSAEWVQEAKRRGLPIIEKSFHAMKVLKEPKTQVVFQDVLNKEELHARYLVMIEHYSKIINMEAKLLVELFQTQILPVALQYQTEIAKGNDPVSASLLKKLQHTLSHAYSSVDQLEESRQKASHLHEEKGGQAFCDDVSPKMLEARKWIDELETLLDDRLWPLPKYRELLFLL